MSKIDFSKFTVPYLKLDAIHEKADNFRAKHWNDKLPIDVLEIVEQKLLLDIIPRKDLKRNSSVEAIISNDFESIWVDEDVFMDERYENRLRYSVAHEIGHLELHKKLYKSFDFNTIEEWIELIIKIPEREYNFIEFQAYEFAGRLLVPKESLLISLGRQKNNINRIGKIVDKQLVEEYVASAICKEFGVSSEVILKRITKEEINILSL